MGISNEPPAMVMAMVVAMATGATATIPMPTGANADPSFTGIRRAILGATKTSSRNAAASRLASVNRIKLTAKAKRAPPPLKRALKPNGYRAFGQFHRRNPPVAAAAAAKSWAMDPEAPTKETRLAPMAAAREQTAASALILPVDENNRSNMKMPASHRAPRVTANSMVIFVICRHPSQVIITVG